MKFRHVIGLACAFWAGVCSAPALAAESASQPAPVSAETSANAGVTQVRHLFEERFPSMKVQGVNLTPYGIYEVQIGMDLLYTDADVTWVMQGPLIDAMTRADITQARLEQLGAVNFDQLPLELAVKQVKGDGSRKVAIFEDPNCGYCKQLHQTLKSVDNLTIYTFLYPILSPDSTVKARNIWCANDAAQTWSDWMVRGKTPPAAQCDNAPIDQVVALGQKLLVRGTPTLFFTDNTRASGALPLEMLQQRLGGQ